MWVFDVAWVDFDVMNGYSNFKQSHGQTEAVSWTSQSGIIDMTSLSTVMDKTEYSHGQDGPCTVMDKPEHLHGHA